MQTQAHAHLHMDVEICNWNKLLKWHMTENRIRNRHRHILNKSNRSVFHFVLYIFHPSQSFQSDQSVFFFSMWKNLPRFFPVPILTNPVIFNPPPSIDLLILHLKELSSVPYKIWYHNIWFVYYVSAQFVWADEYNNSNDMICVTKENHLIRINI